MRRGSKERSAAGEPPANERGFALLIVFLMAAAIAFTFYQQLPRVAFESQRDKEELLIERGEQYKRAIQLYVVAYQRFPAKIEDLENTNQKRYLRRRYIDPMTGKDEWRLIHVNAAGLLTDSLVQKPPANPTGQLAGSSPNATGPGTNVGTGTGIGTGIGTNNGIGTNTGLGTNGATGANPGTANGTFPTGSPNPFNSNGGTPDAQQQVNAAVLRRPSDRLFNPTPVTPQNPSVQPQDDPANWPPISLFPAQGQNGQAIPQGQQPFGQQPFGQQAIGQPNGQAGAPQQINPQFNTQFPGQQAPGQQFPSPQQFQPQPFQVQQSQQLPVQQQFPGQQSFPGQQPIPGQPFTPQQVQQQFQQQNPVDPLQPQFPSDQQAVVQPQPFQVQGGGALPAPFPPSPGQPQLPGQTVTPNQFPGQAAFTPQNAVQNQVTIGPDGQFIPVQNSPAQIPGAQTSGANPVQTGVQQPGGAQPGTAAGAGAAGTQNSALQLINDLLTKPNQVPTGLGSNNNGGIGAGIAGV